MIMKYSLKYQLASYMRSKGYNFKEHLRPEVIEMQKEINALSNKSINFEIKVYPDGSWTAIATNVKGLLTGSHKQSEINELIKDAIFTYYGVPPKYAHDKLLRNTGEPVTAEQQPLLEDMIAEVSKHINAASLINTIPAKVYDKNGKQALPGEGRLVSGLCGSGIKWAGLDMVKRMDKLRKKKGYNYEIIGIGGVMTPADFHEYRKAGADAVQACTGPMWNPNLAHEIAQSLKSK